MRTESQTTEPGRWELLQPDEWADYDEALILPWSSPDLPALALELGSPADRRFAWLLKPGPVVVGHAAPVEFVSTERLKNPETWRRILARWPAAAADLAAYGTHLARVAPEAACQAGVFLEALGRKTDYRSRADWEELANLDELSMDLNRAYDFPIAILRLFDRLDASERRSWMELWAERRVKKNLIRDMIQDLYDLTPVSRSTVLKACSDLATAWKSTARPLPGERLRDLVRQARWPRLSALEEKLRGLRTQIKLEGGVRLTIPRDIEAGELQVELRFSSVEQLARQCDSLTSAENSAALAAILDQL